MFCNECGKENASESNFCKYCGCEMEKKTSTLVQPCVEPQLTDNEIKNKVIESRKKRHKNKLKRIMGCLSTCWFIVGILYCISGFNCICSMFFYNVYSNIVTYNSANSTGTNLCLYYLFIVEGITMIILGCYNIYTGVREKKQGLVYASNNKKSVFVILFVTEILVFITAIVLNQFMTVTFRYIDVITNYFMEFCHFPRAKARESFFYYNMRRFMFVFPQIVFLSPLFLSLPLLVADRKTCNCIKKNRFDSNN